MIFQSATLVSDYDWIYPADDALDSDAEGFGAEYEAAVETSDPSRVPVKPGQQPVLFKLRHVRGMAKKVLTENVIRHQREDGMIGMPSCYLACKLGLVSARHLVNEKGEEVEIPRQHSRDYESDVVTESFLRQLNEVNNGDLINRMGIDIILNMRAKKN